jgi:hypothetical protein
VIDLMKLIDSLAMWAALQDGRHWRLSGGGMNSFTIQLLTDLGAGSPKEVKREFSLHLLRNIEEPWFLVEHELKTMMRMLEKK